MSSPSEGGSLPAEPVFEVVSTLYLSTLFQL